MGRRATGAGQRAYGRCFITFSTTIINKGPRAAWTRPPSQPKGLQGCRKNHAKSASPRVRLLRSPTPKALGTLKCTDLKKFFVLVLATTFGINIFRFNRRFESKLFFRYISMASKKQKKSNVAKPMFFSSFWQPSFESKLYKHCFKTAFQNR